MPANLRVSARFLSAKKKEDLQRILVLYQMRRQAQVKIINVSPDPEGGWTAWFYDESTKSELPSVTELMQPK